MKLIDPWFDAAFINGVVKQENGLYGYYAGDFPNKGGAPVAFADAVGVIFWCPCGYGKPQFPLDGGRPHGCLVVFAGRGAPADFGPHSKSDPNVRPRWTIAGGSGLADLTLTPSIDVGKPSCWHGFITNGEVRTC